MGCNCPFLQTNYKINENQVQDPCNTINPINATFKPLRPEFVLKQEKDCIEKNIILKEFADDLL